MAASPQFGATAVYAYNVTAITAANTTTDGTSGTITFLSTNTAGTTADWVAGTGGAFIDYVKIVPTGTNVATVMRLWANANATNATAANNNLIDEVTCPASTVSQVAALAPVVLSVKRWFPAGTKFFVTIGTAVAAGFDVTAYGSQM
jgi:hypothetical protein